MAVLWSALLLWYLALGDRVMFVVVIRYCWARYDIC